MPTEKSKAYWRERSLLLEDAQRKEASQYAETWQREFDKANARMQKELEQWYGRITDKDGNGVSLADAKRMMNKKELEEFRWTLEEYIEHARANGNLAFERELTNASAQQHIKMIEARLLALKAEGERLFTEKPLADFLSDTLQNAYDRTAFEIQIGTGEGQLMQSVNGHDLDAVMREPWQGGTFSSRIWKNKEQLIRELQKTLMQALMRGDSAFEAGKRLEKVMGTSRNNATRLVYTESAYFRERGSLKAMKELGTKTLEIIATLDMLTCKICGELDGTKVPMDTAEVGVTVPIFHPRCRCTSAPELDVALRGATERAARDPVSGKTYYVPAETTFAQWKEEQDRLAEQSQYERYKSRLGDDAPETIEAFRSVKRAPKAKQWLQLFETDYTRRGKLAAHPETALPSADKATSDPRKFTEYFFNPKSKDGAPKGVAFSSHLGYNADNWQDMLAEIQAKARVNPVGNPKQPSKGGLMYEQPMVLYGKTGNPMDLIAAWQIDETNAPRLVTVSFSKKKKGGAKKE